MENLLKTIEKEEKETGKIRTDYYIKNFKLSKDILKKFEDYWDWDEVCQYQKLNEQFVQNMIDVAGEEETNFDILFCLNQMIIYQDFSEEFYIKNKELIQNEELKLLANRKDKYPSFKYKMLQKKDLIPNDKLQIFKDKYEYTFFNLKNIVFNNEHKNLKDLEQTMNIIINDYLDKYDLPEDYISSFTTEALTTMFNHQLLSTNFISNNIFKIDEIGWENIIRNYVLSDNFIEQFKDYLDFNHLALNQNLSKNIIEKYYNKFDKYILEKFQNYKRKE